MPKIAAAFIVMAIVIAAVLIARSETGAERPDKTAEMVSKHLAKTPRGSLRPEAVLAISPGKSSLAPAASQKLSADFREMLAAPTYGPLFARLSSMPDRNPEQQWMLSRILYRCGRVDPKEPQPKNASYKPVPAEDARAKFIASLDPDDPDYAKRVASYDSIRRDHCAGVADSRISHDDWRGMVQLAAEAGSPRARIDLMRDDVLEQSRVKQMAGTYSPPDLSSQQVEALKEAMTSGDPYAIDNGADLMVGPYANFSLRDAQGRPLDFNAFRDAATLLACDAGYPCRDSPAMDQACALVGHCAADNLRDYIMYYRSSPYQSQLIAQYQGSLGVALSRGDWSGFRFNSGPPTFPGWIR